METVEAYIEGQHTYFVLETSGDPAQERTADRAEGHRGSRRIEHQAGDGGDPCGNHLSAGYRARGMKKALAKMADA